ncbi:response regulator [Deltaproteobacteria bacterium TL4]
MECLAEKEKSSLKRYTGIFVLLWTVVIGGSLSWNLFLLHQGTDDMARIQARASFQKDVLYRRWNSMNGGVYVAVSAMTSPNPHLEISERDVQTLSGKRLPLITPAYMNRQVYELGAKETGVQGHITSINPIRPENKADAWETEALRSFEKGKTEVSSIVSVKGRLYMRLMRPLVTEKGCLKCHENQGYQEGDVRGGISISVPMEPLEIIEWKRMISLILGHGLVWILGLLGIGYGIFRGLEVIEGRQLSNEKIRKLSTAVEQSPSSIVITDLQGKIEYVNPKFSQLTGYSLEEALGKNPRILKSGKVSSETYKALWTDLLAGKEWRGELHNKKKDGELYWEYASISPIKNEAGEMTHFLAIKEDIADRKQMEAELIQAKEQAEASNRAKSAFLASMSHEIRTPMNGVIGMTGLLLKTELNAKQQEYAETVRLSGMHLLSLINDILDFSKIEAGRMDLEEQAFDLKLCIEDALALIASKAAEKDLELIYLLEPKVPPFIRGDVTRLRQILVNLLSNAVKFTEAGEIMVSLKKLSQTEDSVKLQFSVRDTGIGIPADKKHRLFNAFSQVDVSTTRKYGGTGLGLAISARLTQLMGGEMWVESQEGQGSTFYFTIQTQETLVEPKIFMDEHLPELQNKQVLVVDDNQTNLRVLTLHCEHWKMVTRATTSPRQALDWIESGSAFDVAILDFQMPDMNGLQLGTEIRKRRAKDTLPMILFSSLTPEEGTEPWSDPFNAHISKPIRESLLFSTLVELLSGKPHAVLSDELKSDPHSKLGEKMPLRILVAEDNRINQTLVLALLHELGYLADLASNGLEVLENLKRQDYDVILMDVQMPEMDGLQATRQIVKHYPPEKRPRIIAVTANAIQGDRERCIQAGMDDYISKPIEEKELLSVLERWGKQIAVPASGQEETQENEVLDDKMISKMKPALRSQLIQIFLELTPVSMEQIKHYAKNKDPHHMGQEAHSFKGSSLAIGANQLATLCGVLQKKGETEDLSEIDDLLTLLEKSYAQVCNALKQY